MNSYVLGTTYLKRVGVPSNSFADFSYPNVIPWRTNAIWLNAKRHFSFIIEPLLIKTIKKRPAPPMKDTMAAYKIVPGIKLIVTF